MLSSVLRSKRAIHVNIQIMRAFNNLRKMIVTHEDLKNKIEGIEKKYDKQFRNVFEAITKLIEDDESRRRKSATSKNASLNTGKKQEKLTDKNINLFAANQYLMLFNNLSRYKL